MLLNLTNTDKKAIIDEKNRARVMKYKWQLKQSSPGVFYVATSIGRKTVYLHRFIIQAQLGMDVHHKDENPLNNLEENLEERESIPHRCYHLSKKRELVNQKVR